MTDFLPIMWKPTPKHHFIALGYQFLNSQEMSQHTQAIKTHCSQTGPFSNVLSQALWDELYAKGDAKEIDPIYEIWQSAQDLIHLNSKELIFLLREHVEPLEKRYEYIIQHLAPEKQNKINLIRPTWLIKEENKIAKQAKKNIARLKSLKEKILKSLYYRCQSHAWLKKTQYIEDVLAGLCHKINSLELLDKPINFQASSDFLLDDDTRLIIFDILHDYGFNQEELEKDVSHPVLKRKNISMLKIKRDHNIRELCAFRDEMLSKLELDGAADVLFQIRTQYILIPKHFKQSLNECIQGIINPQTVKDWATWLWQKRYFAFIILSFIGYQYLAFTLKPIALFLSETAYHFINFLLFTCVAMAPIWWLIWNKANEYRHSFNKIFTTSKRQQLLEALFCVERAELFINHYLIHTIVDISHFDVSHIEKLANLHKSKLNQATKYLKTFSWWEKRFCKGVVEKASLELIQRCHDANASITMHLFQLAKHMAERVGDDIDVLITSLDKKKLVPILAKEQLSRLLVFIEKYGNETLAKVFHQNTNVIDKWLNKINVHKFAYAYNGDDSSKAPWGGFVVSEEVFNGWEILLETFVRKDNRTNVLKLHSVLKGKGKMTSRELDEILKSLIAPEKTKEVKAKISAFIFHTLEGRPAQHASLIEQELCGLIINWHKQHQEQIKAAKKVMNKIFDLLRLDQDELANYLDEIDDQQLSMCFELLDGADIYANTRNISHASASRQNKARKFFEDYQGQNSIAYRLVKLIPEKEKGKLIARIARKRLEWIIANLNTSVDPDDPFDEIDVQLFHNLRLLDKSNGFKFSTVVKQSAQYDTPWSINMERFLKSCQNYCLDSGGLYNKYVQKNKNIKPFILNQHCHPTHVDIAASEMNVVIVNNKECLRA